MSKYSGIVPALKNIVIVINTLNRFLPFRLSKISGYAQSIVIVRDIRVSATVRNAVQKNALIYFMSESTVLYALNVNPLGIR